MKLILLTGIPGTGKTTIGNHLADNRGFRHIDFEDGVALPRMVRFGDRGFRKEVATMRQQKQEVIVTWGFVPDVQLGMVKLMRGLGFQWVWLDGDREAARRVFLDRGTVAEQLLDIQMEKIARHIDLAVLKPQIVNPFGLDGRFRPLEAVAAEVAGDSGAVSGADDA